MPKVVIDTSVFVAALLTKDKTAGPVQVLNKWQQGQFTLVMSPQILNEIVLVLIPRNISEKAIENLVTAIAATALNIPGAYEATRLDNIDPKDNIFLAATYEATAAYLVSLDSKHLLPLKHDHGTQILLPTLFLAALNQSQNQSSS